MKIRKFREEDAKECARIIYKTFSEFNKKEGPRKAIKKYLDFFNPKQDKKVLIRKFKRSPIIFVAEKEKKVIGIIRGNKNRIINLYVLGKFHKKDVGKKLLKRFEKEVKKTNSKFIKVNASIYSTEFYKKQGYKRTMSTRKLKHIGILVNPMKKDLNKIK